MTTDVPVLETETGAPPWRSGRRGVDGGLMIGMMAVPWFYVWFFLGPGYAWWLRIGAFLYAFGPLVLLILSAAGILRTGPGY